jgi:hypothetical protein
LLFARALSYVEADPYLLTRKDMKKHR